MRRQMSQGQALDHGLNKLSVKPGGPPVMWAWVDCPPPTGDRSSNTTDFHNPIFWASLFTDLIFQDPFSNCFKLQAAVSTEADYFTPFPTGLFKLSHHPPRC